MIKKSNGERKLPDDIADIINDNNFWLTLLELQNLLYPLCGFLNKLQKDTASLYEVIHCFAYVTKIFNEHMDLDFSEKMVWKMWKQAMLRRSWMNMTNGNTKSWFINKVAKAWTRHRDKLEFPKKSFNQQWQEKQSK